MDISIIIPMKNAETYVLQCIESILKMDCSTFTYEVIVVDDKSSDNSREIVQKLKEANDVIKLIDGPGGLTEARCAGLAKAQGRYIGWVDSDDYIEPDMFSTLFEAAECTKAQITICDYDFFPKKTSRKKKWFRPINEKVTPYNVERNTQLWNKLFSKEFLDGVDFMDLLQNCSEGACAVLLVMAKEITTVNRVLYHYRVGHASLSGSYIDSEKYVRNIELTKAQRRAVANLDLNESWYEYFDYRIIYSLLQLLVIAGKNKRFELYQMAVAELKCLHYKNNRYLSSVLNENHGRLKSQVLIRLVPVSWSIAKLVGFLF